MNLAELSRDILPSKLKYFSFSQNCWRAASQHENISGHDICHVILYFQLPLFVPFFPNVFVNFPTF